MENVQKFFQQIGQLTGRLWKERDYDRECFPELAARALAELPPNEHVTFEQVVESTMLSDPLPHQNDIAASFADPPFTAFHWGHDFRLEVLFWVTGVPAIHQHAFSGAFHVLHGSSLHTEWTFVEHGKWTDTIRVGELTRRSAELLVQGDSRQIFSGGSFIHSTFHLQRPSVSVVIRTIQDPKALPQYSFVPPGIAHTDHTSDSIRRRLQVLGMLRKSGRANEHDDIVKRVCEVSDLTTVFHVLTNAYLAVGPERRADLLDVAASRHVQFVKTITPALEFMDRRQRMINLRAIIDDEGLRFFLAMLLYMSEPDYMLSMVGKQYPGSDSVRQIAAWTAEIAWRIHGVEEVECSQLVETLYLRRRPHGEIAAPIPQAETSTTMSTLRESWLLGPFIGELLVQHSEVVSSSC